MLFITILFVNFTLLGLAMFLSVHKEALDSKDIFGLLSMVGSGIFTSIFYLDIIHGLNIDLRDNYKIMQKRSTDFKMIF